MALDFKVPKGEKFPMGHFCVIGTNVRPFKIPDWLGLVFNYGKIIPDWFGNGRLRVKRLNFCCAMTENLQWSKIERKSEGLNYFSAVRYEPPRTNNDHKEYSKKFYLTNFSGTF